jgi:hypothetical protein
VLDGLPRGPTTIETDSSNEIVRLRSDGWKYVTPVEAAATEVLMVRLVTRQR